jgi:antitoxin PrlF
MDVPATVTSKGQVTIPAPVRRAMQLTAGSRIVFHLEGEQVRIEQPGRGRRARITRAPDFFALAGTVAVPDELRGADWETVRRLARTERLQRRRP